MRRRCARPLSEVARRSSLRGDPRELSGALAGSVSEAGTIKPEREGGLGLVASRRESDATFARCLARQLNFTPRSLVRQGLRRNTP
jgi:hypothetical protein